MKWNKKSLRKRNRNINGDLTKEKEDVRPEIEVECP
jgi:hypothetical protein